MRYRALGATGLIVSEIGFGAWGIGGHHAGAVAYGPTDDDDSRRAIRRAVERGVTFFDTAAFYGLGHSEEILGEVLAPVRSQVVIATKVGFLEGARQDFSARRVRESLEESLRRLRTDYVDLYQLHSPDIAAVATDDELGAVLDALRRAGKARAIGVSLRSPDDGAAAVTRLGAAALQVNFNMLDQRACDNGLFEFCHTANVGVIVRTPLCFGFLTGRYSAAEAFVPSDHRSRWSRAQLERWADAPRLFADALASRQAQTPAQAALRFCLSYPAVSTTIPGMLTTGHVDENVVAGETGPLAGPERAACERIYREHTFFVAGR